MRSIMKPTLVLLFVLPVFLISKAQLVRNTGSLNIAADGNMFINGSFENATANGRPLINGTLQLTGDFTNNGVDLDAAGTGTTVFSGTGTSIQNINGIISTTFYNLSKPNSNTVIIARNETIKNTFSLTQGLFQLNDKILTLNGTITGTGFLTGTALSGLVIGTAGTELGTIYFDQTTDTITNILKTLTITNGGRATVGNALNIAAGSAAAGYGTVTVNGAIGNLNANAKLTLRSNSLGDARVAESSGRITDSVLVERYIPVRRAWRFINVPFGSTNQSINAAWMEGATPNQDIYTRNNPKPGYGLEITYWHNSQDSGFDENTTENPSILTWDPVLDDWGAGVTSTYSTKITDRDAYFLFIRGDRSVDLSWGTSAPPTATTLRAKGILNETGGSITKTYPTITSGQRFFAGNPFASAVKLLDVLTHSTNVVQTKFWVWNPNNVSLAYPKNVGNYVTYDNGVFTPGGIDSTYTGGTNLQIGQGFMVEASGNSPQLVFQQTDKNPEEAIVFGLQAMQRRDPVHPVIYTNLLSAAMGAVPADGVAAAFGKKYAAGVDADDAVKMWNQNESMALIRDDQALAIEFRPVPKSADTLFYKMYLYIQPYTLKIFSRNLPADLPAEAWLVDKYLNTETPVNLYDTTQYSFTPNSDTNSYVNRFLLVFNHAPKDRLPVTVNSGNKSASVAEATSGVKFYPNPVATNQATLQFNNMVKGSYEIVIYNANGEKLASRHLQHNGGNTNYTLPISSAWTSGIYNVSVINKASQNAISLQLVINR
jgi:hypothetical protein